MTTQIQRRLVALEAAYRGSDASLRILIGLVGEVVVDVLLRERVEGGAERLLVVAFVPGAGDGGR